MREDYEKYIVTCVILQPDLVERFDIRLVHNNSYQGMLYSIRSMSRKEGKIEPSVLASLTGHNIISLSDFYALESKIIDVPNCLYQSVDSLKVIDREERLGTDMEVIRTLLQSQKITDAKNKFDDIVSEFSDVSVNIHDIEEDMLCAINETNGFPCGISQFDNQGGLFKSNILTIFGDTGSMKTMVSVWMCLEILIRNPKFTCLYFEKEMPVKDISRRVTANMLDITLQEIMEIGTMNAEIKEEATEALARQIKKFMSSGEPLADAIKRFKIVPCDTFNTAADIDLIIRKERPDVWVVDFVGMLEHGISDAVAGSERTFKRLKDTVQETDTLGILLAQIKQNTVETRNMKVPVMSDIEWGSKLKQYSAYAFATFYANNYYQGRLNINPRMFFLIGKKNRNAQNAIIPLEAYPEKCKFVGASQQFAIDWSKWLHDYENQSWK